MLWNLVATHYERYHLHHVTKILLLILYSFFGALIFITLEAENEKNEKNQEAMNVLRNSLVAKSLFVDQIQKMFVKFVEKSEFSETELRRILSDYDATLGVTINNQIVPKWDIWGGLYYSGTIYTTIGYGDLAATTFGGRLFTMFYAMLGIPMVVTILNDWGNMLFSYVDKFWKSIGKKYWNKLKSIINNLKKKLRIGRRSKDDLGNYESQLFIDPYQSSKDHADKDEPLPFLLIAVVLSIWVLVCIGYFSIFENWTFFESIYFFFISMTTIGFGDISPKHSVAVGGIFFILGGLSVVSMSINVIQIKLEFIFNKIVQDIEKDFKTSLSVGGTIPSPKTTAEIYFAFNFSAEEGRKKSIGVSEIGSIEPTRKKTMSNEGGEDISKKYAEGMDGTNKFLLKFMSNHQKKMLNEKFDERARMRNSYTQTLSQIKVASVQTVDKPDIIWDDEPEEEEQAQSKSRINTRRLYIYNTGE